MREVGGRGPGIEAAKPEVVPPLAKWSPEFQQAGADAAPIDPTDRFLQERLPRVVREYLVVVEGPYEVIPGRAGVPLGGCHIGVTSGEVTHKSVSSAPVLGAPVEEGQQGAVRDRLPAEPAPPAAVQLPAQRGGEVSGEHDEQGPWNVAQPGQHVIARRPLFYEARHSEPGAPVLWRERPVGGCVAPQCVCLGGSEQVCGLEHEAGRRGAQRSEDTSPPHPVWGPWAACSHSVMAAASHGRSGPVPQITVGRGRVCGPHPSSGRAANCGVGVPGARVVCAAAAPFARPLRAHNVRLPRGHGIATDAPRWEERVLEVL